MIHATYKWSHRIRVYEIWVRVRVMIDVLAWIDYLQELKRWHYYGCPAVICAETVSPHIWASYQANSSPKEAYLYNWFFDTLLKQVKNLWSCRRASFAARFECSMGTMAKEETTGHITLLSPGTFKAFVTRVPLFFLAYIRELIQILKIFSAQSVCWGKQLPWSEERSEEHDIPGFNTLDTLPGAHVPFHRDLSGEPETARRHPSYLKGRET